MDLYSNFASQFSSTRQSPWNGWNKMLGVLDFKGLPLKVLDLGCGNGRFLKFLVSKNLSIEEYIGVDNSEQMLQIAKDSFRGVKLNCKFEVLDLERNDWLDVFSPKHFSLIAGFGLIHHLRTFKSRKNLIKNSAAFLAEQGYLVLTFWQFMKYARFRSKIITGLSNPEKNDFVLTFEDSSTGKHARRFCHFCDDKEMKKLSQEPGLKLVCKFFADGKDKNQNLYKIWQKSF